MNIIKICLDCKNQVPKIHHVRCKKCWEKYQLSKGNISLITGVPIGGWKK